MTERPADTDPTAADPGAAGRTPPRRTPTPSGPARQSALPPVHGSTTWAEFAARAPRPAPPAPANPWTAADAGLLPGAGDATMPWAPTPAPLRGPKPVDATRVMPAIPAGPVAPARPAPRSGVPSPPPPARPVRVPERKPALIGRFVVALAGLLAAGCLLLGIALLVLQLLVPSRGGGGLETATGPGWPRVAMSLGVGLAAEIGFWVTRQARWPVRVTVATISVLAVLAVFVLSWWR